LGKNIRWLVNILFGGETRIPCRETKLTYIDNDPNNPNNYQVYSKDQDLGCFILSVENEPKVCTKMENTPFVEKDGLVNGMWKMYFDGASSWEGSRIGILLISPSVTFFTFCFILQFEKHPTNNVCEYEAFVLDFRSI
jgi:hypothetical protein